MGEKGERRRTRGIRCELQRGRNNEANREQRSPHARVRSHTRSLARDANANANANGEHKDVIYKTKGGISFDKAIIVAKSTAQGGGRRGRNECIIRTIKELASVSHRLLPSALRANTRLFFPPVAQAAVTIIVAVVVVARNVRSPFDETTSQPSNLSLRAYGSPISMRHLHSVERYRRPFFLSFFFFRSGGDGGEIEVHLVNKCNQRRLVCPRSREICFLFLLCVSPTQRSSRETRASWLSLSCSVF